MSNYSSNTFCIFCIQKLRSQSVKKWLCSSVTCINESNKFLSVFLSDLSANIYFLIIQEGDLLPILSRTLPAGNKNLSSSKPKSQSRPILVIYQLNQIPTAVFIASYETTWTLKTYIMFSLHCIHFQYKPLTFTTQTYIFQKIKITP